MTNIRAEAELRDFYDQPGELPANAYSDRLDIRTRHFIELSPLVIVASSNTETGVDISPRGDAPGFVRIVDDKTLIIPDRKGNNKIDTMRNIVRNPQIGLMFIIPGINEVLRIKGLAEIRVDNDLCASFAVRDSNPKSVMVIAINKVFPHCGKALIRARLWDEGSQRERKRDEVPSLAQMALAMADVHKDVEVVDQAIEKEYRENLY